MVDSSKSTSPGKGLSFTNNVMDKMRDAAGIYGLTAVPTALPPLADSLIKEMNNEDYQKKYPMKSKMLSFLSSQLATRDWKTIPYQVLTSFASPKTAVKAIMNIYLSKNEGSMTLQKAFNIYGRTAIVTMISNVLEVLINTLVEPAIRHLITYDSISKSKFGSFWKDSLEKEALFSRLLFIVSRPLVIIIEFIMFKMFGENEKMISLNEDNVFYNQIVIDVLSYVNDLFSGYSLANYSADFMNKYFTSSDPTESWGIDLFKPASKTTGGEENHVYILAIVISVLVTILVMIHMNSYQHPQVPYVIVNRKQQLL